MQLALAAILFLNVPIGVGSSVFNPASDQCRTRAGQITRLIVPSIVYRQPILVSVYLPPCYTSSANSLPVIYLLHGGGADETQWPDLRVQAEADDLIANGAQPFVVVMPSGAYQVGIDYAAFVLDDLIPSVSDQLHLRTDSAGRAIGGISLGGYWALNIAFHHPDRFAATGGYSPVVASRTDDLVTLARTATGLVRLRITLDVGDSDALVTGTQQLAKTLRARELDVSFTAHSGGHNRSYWRSHTNNYLSFMLASFTSPAPRLTCRPER